MNPRPTTDPVLSGPSRRAVLGVTVAGATGLLAACGSGSSGGDTSATGSSGGGASKNLVATAKVPVGEGVILSGPKVVVTQPTAGDFKAFTAVCTHMSCLVTSIKDGTITCPCHGSTYSIKDGSVTGGPAPAPLAAIAIKVDGAEIVKA
jgi:nitrite reductase/ring-hydroxylating ferredoxin subunit